MSLRSSQLLSPRASVAATAGGIDERHLEHDQQVRVVEDPGAALAGDRGVDPVLAGETSNVTVWEFTVKPGLTLT